jgi:hypothetical protein
VRRGSKRKKKDSKTDLTEALHTHAGLAGVPLAAGCFPFDFELLAGAGRAVHAEEVDRDAGLSGRDGDERERLCGVTVVATRIHTVREGKRGHLVLHPLFKLQNQRSYPHGGRRCGVSVPCVPSRRSKGHVSGQMYI